MTQQFGEPPEPRLQKLYMRLSATLKPFHVVTAMAKSLPVSFDPESNTAV